MPIFRYEAADRDGAVFHDLIDATSEDEALLSLSIRNLVPVSLEEEGKEKIKIHLSTGLFERVTVEDRIALVRNLAVTLRAGLNIIEAVDILSVDATKKVLRDILETAKSSLQKGLPLSQTFSDYKKYFSPVFTGLMRAGEASGHLDKALEQLAEQMAKEYRLGKKVTSALAYPVILLVASFCVLALLLIFVLPRLAHSFQMSGVELPLITKIILAASGLVSSHLFLFGGLLVGLFITFNILRKTEKGSLFLLKVVLKIPVASMLVKKIALVRFSRNLGTLISSGINIIEALKISADTVGNIIYKEKILNAVGQVRNGVALSDALKGDKHYFPHLLVSMIAVGEITGTLEYVLKTFSDFYDEEVDNALKDLTTFLEPIMLLGMGLMIGVIALSILLPIYQLIGKFS